jgi:hypothetical protein
MSQLLDLTGQTFSRSEGFNQSVRLRTPQVVPETFEWRCEKNHLRSPENTTHNGFCKTCAMATLRSRPSRWVKHTIVAKQEPTEVENPWLTDYNARQQAARAKEQQREQQRRDRESQEQAAQKAYELMDATLEEIKIVNSRIAARKVLSPPSLYVAEIRKLRAERT